MHRKTKRKNFLIGIFFLVLSIVNMSAAEVTHRNVLGDFETDPVYLDDRSSPTGWYFESRLPHGGVQSRAGPAGQASVSAVDHRERHDCLSLSDRLARATDSGGDPRLGRSLARVWWRRRD